MADQLAEIKNTLASIIDGAAREQRLEDLAKLMTQAVVDIGVLLERMTKTTAAAPVVNVAAPAVNVAPTMQSDWTSLEIDAPVDGLGRPTGKMTIRKVK